VETNSFQEDLLEHTVLHGEKRQSRRMQWFQPVYVGLNER